MSAPPQLPNPKEIAGRRAASLVETGMTVGLGTGSTVHFTLLALGERIREEGLEIVAVPTSLDTHRKASEFGIPLTALSDVESIDLTIDGADEIDPSFHMIKGGGGALLREKVVAYISRREVIVIGRSKLVTRLGTTFNLPVEVVPFARPMVEREIRRMGASPFLRTLDDGGEYFTDNGGEILDCNFEGGIGDPSALERSLDLIPGVVESGLFVNLAHVCIVGDEDGTCEFLEKKT